MARVVHVEKFGSSGFRRCDDVRLLLLLPPAPRLAVIFYFTSNPSDKTPICSFMFCLCAFSQCFVYIFFIFFNCGNVIRGVWKVQGSFPVFVGVFILTCIRKHYSFG